MGINRTVQKYNGKTIRCYGHKYMVRIEYGGEGEYAVHLDGKKYEISSYVEPDYNRFTRWNEDAHLAWEKSIEILREIEANIE